MIFRLSKKMITIMALCGLVVLRLVDLAIFDPEHDHVATAHIQAHASKMAHDHSADEVSEHESPDNMSLHLSFHALASVYISAPSVDMAPANRTSFKYHAHSDRSVKTPHSQPPVPPPLA